MIADLAPEPNTSSEDLSRSTTDSIFLISTIIDSGVGLTKEEQKKLFQKLDQSSPKTHIEYDGSGLGLFISKALVKAQGGRLTLESEKHKGTRLTFYICVKKVDPPTRIPTSGLAESFGLRTTFDAKEGAVVTGFESQCPCRRRQFGDWKFFDSNSLDQSKSLDAAVTVGRISNDCGESWSGVSRDSGACSERE